MNKKGKICAMCGTKYPADFERNECRICEDDRQYVPKSGQEWKNDKELLAKHSVKIVQIKENLYEFEINPKFAIGQRALLILLENGNVLWDCIPLLDEAAKLFIEQKGGLKAIVISHPHYYSNMAEWAEEFNCAIYLHEKDKKWVVNGSSKIKYWSGEKKEFWDGMRVLKIGGHFPASSILMAPHLSASSALFCGDTFSLSPSMAHFSVMYSYPNKMPVSIAEVSRIKEIMEKVEFDEVYGFRSLQNLTKDAKQILLTSLERYK